MDPGPSPEGGIGKPARQVILKEPIQNLYRPLRFAVVAVLECQQIERLSGKGAVRIGVDQSGPCGDSLFAVVKSGIAASDPVLRFRRIQGAVLTQGRQEADGLTVVPALKMAD